MNLTQYIIYQGNIMNIWWGLWSVGSEAATITLLSWCSLWVQPRESRIRFLLSFSTLSSRTETQAACGPKGLCRVHWENDTSTCQAARQLSTLCWISWKIKVYDQVRSQTGFIFTLCHDNPQLTRGKLFPSDFKTCSTIDRWAWIQRCVVFCHPLLHWPWQRICRAHKMHSCSGFLTAGKYR